MWGDSFLVILYALGLHFLKVNSFTVAFHKDFADTHVHRKTLIVLKISFKIMLHDLLKIVKAHT